jgi:dihydroflavonol-4-reductase
MIVHFLNGNMKAYTNLTQNLVDVRDVAAGHALALEKGRPGERYVLGGENLPMREIVRLLAEITGLPAPWFAIPHPILHGMSLINEWISNHVTHRLPIAPLEAKLHAVDSRPFDTSKARRELGYQARPAREVLIDAVRWFVQEGFCPPATAQRIAEQPAFREG